MTTSLISVDLLKKELDLPSVVFSDASYTKMQDDLAVRLFSLKTIAYLFEMRNYSVLSYFLPICLLCVSLEERNLQVNDKISLLELGFYYMLAYNNMLMELKSQLPQKRAGLTNTSVLLMPLLPVSIAILCAAYCKCCTR